MQSTLSKHQCRRKESVDGISLGGVCSPQCLFVCLSDSSDFRRELPWVHFLQFVDMLMTILCSGLEPTTNQINLFPHVLLLVSRFSDRHSLASLRRLSLTRSPVSNSLPIVKAFIQGNETRIGYSDAARAMPPVR